MTLVFYHLWKQQLPLVWLAAAAMRKCWCGVFWKVLRRRCHTSPSISRAERGEMMRPAILSPRRREIARSEEVLGSLCGPAAKESAGSKGLPSSPWGRDRLGGRRVGRRMRLRPWGEGGGCGGLPSALSLTGSGQCPAAEGHGPAYEHKLISSASAGPPAQSACLHSRLRSLSCKGGGGIVWSRRVTEKERRS